MSSCLRHSLLSVTHRIGGGIPAVFSIHDVAPETMESVLNIIDLLEKSGVSPVMLLVIPGKDWQPEQVWQLRSLVDAGYVLAGHGWHHYAPEPKSIYHILHSRFISRNVAEHLALDESAILSVLKACYQWFGQQGLSAPDYYVPPAWAMGSISRQRLRESPFRYYEYLSGIYDSQLNTFNHLPVVGYEADTKGRVMVLRAFNQMNTRLANFRAPLRVGIHPHDLDLKMASDLRQLLVNSTAVSKANFSVVRN